MHTLSETDCLPGASAPAAGPPVDAEPKRRRPAKQPDLSPEEQLAIARELKASLAVVLGDDPDVLMGTLEGETTLFEMIDDLLLADLADQSILGGIAQAIDTLKMRSQRIDARVAKRRAILEQAMFLAERTKIQRPTGTISLSERPRSVKVESEADLPSRFFKVPSPIVDKTAIRAALEAGESVPGAYLTDPAYSITVYRR